MECNDIMDRLITRVYKSGIHPDCPANIQKMETLDENAFWVLGNFCGIPVNNVTEYGKELTDLEWHGNELHFSDDSREMLEKKIISAYLGIKQQLEDKYLETVFDLVVSVDTDSLSGNIRLYEVRGGYHYIEPAHENLSGFLLEAILIDTVNDVKLEEYIPALKEELKEYRLEIHLTEDKEIIIMNPYYDCHIYISWDDEFTIYFGNWHAHYYEDGWDELLGDIKGLISGKIVTVREDCNGEWVSSYISSIEGLPEASETHNNVTEVTVEAWNPKFNRN